MANEFQWYDLMGSKTVFVLNGYPRISETFIAQEIYLLETKGLNLEIVSLKLPREPERQPVNGMIQAPITYTPRDPFLQFIPLAANNLKAAFHYPGNYLVALFKAIGSSFKEKRLKTMKRFFQAGWYVGKKKPASHGVTHFHSHFIHDPTEFTYYVSQITKIPFSISAHAKDIYTIPQHQIRARINSSSLLMTCTQFNVNYIRSIPGVDLHKVHKVFHGIDLGNFVPGPSMPPTQASRIELISVGRLVEKKGYDVILQALKLLQDRGIEFAYEVFGAGDCLNELLDLAKKLGINDSVKFLGVATQPVIIERLRKRGVFLCGSKTMGNGDRDGIPNTLAEAMAMELPVVATVASGIPELLQDGVQGILVPESNPQLLSEAIEKIWRNPVMAETMGRAGRRRIEEMFSASVCIEKCENLLRSLPSIPGFADAKS